jgi:hypothetical protein
MDKTEQKRRNNLRYRLHRAIRKQGFILVTKERTVYLGYGKARIKSKHLTRLTDEFGYAVQLIIEIV